MIKIVLLIIFLASLLLNQKADGLLWNETYPKGRVIRLSNNMDIYSVGESNKNLAMIVFYDIRGFNITQTRVFCDRLAYEYSSHVVMPDFFRGTVAPDGENRTEWMNNVGNWSKISNDLRVIANWLETSSSSTTPIGLIGFCWGGLQVVRACSNLSERFLTGISIHGSRITPDEVKQLKKPMLFIAAGNDPPLRPNVSDVIEQTNKKLSEQCEYKTYSNMRHGFVAAGANYSNPDNVNAINDVHSTIRNYLDKIRTNSSTRLAINLYFLVIIISFSFHTYLE